ncbi:unnamed protein product [Symbiodinium pilosum]|uniref:Uncharacterized protein n=1 Tax=Symbiodinium pilosum TaxID=2952 RepID=A0A812UB75_SYMPI|nr:unnamed protein product [Symbiodinium pilosum]
MAVLNCGFLRLFQWPLRSDSMRRLEMNKGQAQYSLVDMKKAPSFQEARPGHPPCILLTRVKAGLLFGEKAVTEGLCATGGKAEALFRALQQQMQRFQDSHAKQWSYGTHPAAKPQYVLPTGTAQMNLLEVLNGFTWSEFRPDVTSHPVHNPVLLQVSKDSQDGVGSEEALVKSSRPGKTAKPTKTPKAPSKTGSFEAKACRAQEDLNTHRYPPEDYGNASVRLVFPATPIGDVHLLIQKIQVVQFDIVGELVRNSDTTFLFEITGKEGPGTAFAYVEGIDFKAPDSAVPGITKAASSIDSFFRPVFTFGQKKADSLKEGPLMMKFKMRGEFKLSEGDHWEVLPKAVSDVKLVFGRGGLVQGLINYLVSAYGNMDEIFLKSVWPLLASAIPESLGKVFVQIPQRVGKMGHKFGIQGSCVVWDESNEKCATDQVHVQLKDSTTVALLPKPLTEKYLVSHDCSQDECEAAEESLPLTLLRSYANASSQVPAVFGGTSVETSFDMEYSSTLFPKIYMDSSANAPMKVLEIALGGQGSVLSNLLPGAPGKLTAVGSIVVIEGNKVVIPEVRLERLRLPLLLGGQSEALELNVTLAKVKATSDAPASMIDVMVAYFDATLDQASGLAFKKAGGSSPYPLLEVTLNKSFVSEILTNVERDFPEPTNVRTAERGRADGVVPEAFRQKQAVAPGQLDIHKTLAEAAARVTVSLESDRDADSGEDMLNVSARVVLQTTLDLGSNFWRAVTNRRTRDYGFVHVSQPGVWGPLVHSRLPETPVLLEIGCGELRIFDFGKDAKPYKDLLHSVNLYDVWSNPKGTLETEEAGPCIFIAELWETFYSEKYYFCAEATPMRHLREALMLQWTRFSTISQAMEDAKAADAESFQASRAAGYGVQVPSKPKQAFADSTWFREFNPFDTKSWLPDLPPAHEEDVETPLQRWEHAKSE